MKHFFLDTNVILDFLIERGDSSLDAEQLFQLAIQKKCRMYCSALSYSHLFYITRKVHGVSRAKKNIQTLLTLIAALPVDESHIQDSLQGSFQDLEDGIQYHCCLQSKKIDALITRDNKAFPRKKMAILNVKEALHLVSINGK
jgi:predicted nucleic acid-binding protein